MNSLRSRLSTAILFAAALTSLTGGCRATESRADATAAATTQPKTVEELYMGLSSGPLAHAVVGDLPEGTALQSGDLTVTRDQVDAFIEERATTPEAKTGFEAEAFVIAEQLAVEPLLEREAKQWAEESDQDVGGASIDAHLQSIVEAVIVTDEDLRAFYDTNREMIDGASFEDLKEQLRPVVLREKQGEALDAHISWLGERQEVLVSADFLAEVAPKAFDNVLDQARRSGKPTFVDFGSEGCQACDMMAPIIEELKTELRDRVNVVLIQVGEEQHLAARYGIRSIPVQYIYDAEGREVFMHVGFLGKEAIREQLAALGVE